MFRKKMFICILLLFIFLFAQVISSYANMVAFGNVRSNDGEDAVSKKVNIAQVDSEYSVTPPEEWESIVWKKCLPTAEGNLYGVEYGKGLYIAVGDSGVIKTSVDGVNWEQRISGTERRLNNVIWNGSIFIAVGEGVILTSEDGIKWIKQKEGDQYYISDIAWNGSILVGVGKRIGGTFQTYTSKDGVNWSASLTSNAYNSIIWDGNKFVAVAYSGAIATSVNGVSWTIVTTESDKLIDVASNGGRCVAVGYDGIIKASYNENSWENIDTGVNYNFTSITYGNGLFVAVGFNGHIFTSKDGVLWEDKSYGDYSLGFNSVVYGNGKFVVVGHDGVIFVSDEGANWRCVEP